MTETTTTITESAEADTTVELVAPKRNASADEWAKYAKALGLTVPASATRDQIIELLEGDTEPDTEPDTAAVTPRVSDRKDRYVEVYDVGDTNIRAWYFKSHRGPYRWHMAVMRDDVPRFDLATAPHGYVHDLDDDTKDKVVAALIAEINAP